MTRKRLHSPRRKVGVREVARLAGVSTASVSRVINSPEAVGIETRMHVEAAVRQLGYIPNSAARALSRQRTTNIGAIVPTIDNAIFANSIQALQKRVGERGYNLLLAVSGYDPQIEYQQARGLIMSGVEAINLLGEYRLSETYELLERAGIPFVNTYTYRPNATHPCVGFDNSAASARATRHLIELGHRKIGMIAGIAGDNDRAAARLAGVRDAITQAGLPINEAWFVQRPYAVGEGAAGLRTIMMGSDRPTAILGGNDLLAMGALLEAPDLGLRVPKDISIIGFDDLELAAQLRPSLTTIRVPTTEMSNIAADYLLGTLEGLVMPHNTEVNVDLIVRESTTKPPAE